MTDQAARNEEEREEYYESNYRKVLQDNKDIKSDLESMLKKQQEHDKRFDILDAKFDILDAKIEATKAASETAHKEIIERLERIESRIE